VNAFPGADTGDCSYQTQVCWVKSSAFATAHLYVPYNTFGSLHYNDSSPSFIAHIVVIKSPFMRPQIHLLSGVMDISVFQIHRQHVVTVVSLTP